MWRPVTWLAPAAGGDLAKLLAAKYPGADKSVEAFVQEAIATIGENMGVRRTAALTVKQGVVADYLHNKIDLGPPDTAPPDTIIDSGPSGTVVSSTATFA